MKTLVIHPLFYLFTSLFFGLNIFSYAESNSANYYFVTMKGDTTFCKSLEYQLGNRGELYRLAFTKDNGIKIEIASHKKMPNVVTFYLNGKTFDKIPYDIDSPTEAYAYSERKVDGNLKVYLDQKGQAPFYRFYVRLGPGQYCKANSKSSFNKNIKPFLESCEDFTSSYDGEISNEEDELIKMISFYNFICE